MFRLKSFIVIFFFIFLSFNTVWSSIQHNLAVLNLVQATMNPFLTYQERINKFNQCIKQIVSVRRLENKTFILSVAELEKENILRAQEYLNLTKEFQNMEPGRQLLRNPDFNLIFSGWTTYNSKWSVVDLGDENPAPKVVFTDHKSEELGHLSQTLYLKPSCYLFSITGMTQRTDNIESLWMYWATHDDAGRPQGHVIEKGKDNLPWRRTHGVFCLNGASSTVQKINIAPLSVRGNVKAFLGSARLYELKQKELNQK